MNSDARAQHGHTVYLRVQKGLGMRLGNVWYSLTPRPLNKQPGNEAMFGRAPCLLSQYTELYTEENTELYTPLKRVHGNDIHACSIFPVQHEAFSILACSFLAT